jgi:hypothetical protein
MNTVASYCYIDDKNSTNDCLDLDTKRIYNNKNSEVYKLNFYPPPPSMSPGSLHPKNSLNPGDSYFNKDNKYKSGLPIQNQKNKINNLIMNSNIIKNMRNNNNNSTLQYAHVGHNPKDDTVWTEKSKY